MKPKLLSLTLTFLCLQLQTKMYAQCPSLNQPISCINATTALNRINAFQRFEKTILQSNGITVTDFAISSIAQLETILQNFASDATAYDGIRIYFAVSGPISEAGFDANTLYLILVPTLKTSIVDANGDTVSDDDENDAFVITNGNIIQKSFCTDLFLREWINRYIYLIAPKIEQVYSNYGIKIEESHSLWYSNRFIFKYINDALGPDLLSYLQTHTITSGYIQLGTWLLDLTKPAEKPFTFKIDLLFKFTEPSLPNPVYLSFGISDMIKNVDTLYNKDNKKQKELLSLLKDTYTDTGNPCPTKKCP